MLPPKNALKFLHWFCREDYLEEIEGNLVELYEKQYESSPGRARWRFFWNVLKHFRPAFIRSFKQNYTLTYPDMLHHNFLLAFRNFKRYKSSFFINLIGLSTGLACSLLIFLWVNDELNIDKFHEKDNQLFQVMGHQHFADGILTNGNTPGLLAENLSEEIPEIQYATAVSSMETYSLSHEHLFIRAVGIHASQDYFNTFSYPLIQGVKNQVLNDKSAIVISQALALKLFNTTENIIGKIVTIQDNKQYQVSGIFENIPTNSTVQFDFVLTFEAYKAENPWVLEWGNNGTRTYLVLNEDTPLNAFNEKIADFIKKREEASNITLFLKPYSENYLYGNYKNGVQAGGRIEYIRLFSIIAIFILGIACINFMNLSTAKASRKVKEVGIKKAIGAGRKSLIFQYLGESLLLATLYLFTAIILLVLLLPQFNDITGKQLTLDFNVNLVLSVLSITIFTGLIAGSYPALYLSNFNPATILKGEVAIGKLSSSMGELWVRKGLVVSQFSISVILIVSV